MAEKVSQITACKGRSAEVKERIESWLASGIDELVLVDYADPDGLSEQLLKSKVGRDPRVTVLKVDPVLAGPWFDHGHSRNLGALAARWPTFLFLDADASLRTSAREALVAADRPALITTKAFREPDVGHLPIEWTYDGQLLVDAGLFWGVKGFRRNLPTRLWGADAYDLYFRLRTAYPVSRTGTWPSGSVDVTPHDDERRCRYLPYSLHNRRDQVYRRSHHICAQLRQKGTRADPGEWIDPSDYDGLVSLFRGGWRRQWRPGEDA
jgi:hypothetical protein